MARTSAGPARTRFCAVYVALGAVAVAALGTLALQLRGAPGLGAEQTARRFIATAVQQQHPERGYDLATIAVRGSSTRSDWAHGTSSVVPFPYRAITVKLQLLKRTPDAEQMFVILRSPAPREASNFLLELQRVRGRWLVSYWGPAMLMPALSRGAGPASP